MQKKIREQIKTNSKKKGKENTVQNNQKRENNTAPNGEIKMEFKEWDNFKNIRITF